MIIDKLWEEYREKVITPEATPDQLFQLRLAFFAGMIIFASILADMAEFSDVDQKIAVSRLSKELMEFKNENFSDPL